VGSKVLAVIQILTERMGHLHEYSVYRCNAWNRCASASLCRDRILKN